MSSINHITNQKEEQIKTILVWSACSNMTSQSRVLKKSLAHTLEIHKNKHGEVKRARVEDWKRKLVETWEVYICENIKYSTAGFYNTIFYISTTCISTSESL